MLPQRTFATPRCGFREGVLTADDVIGAQTAAQGQFRRIDAEIGIRLCNAYLSKVARHYGL